MHQPKTKYYVVDFKDEIDRFKTAISYPELPTIDIDVAISQVCTAFECPDIPHAIKKITHEMAHSDWLVEHDAWTSKEEEQEIRRHIHLSVLNLANGFFAKLTQCGMFYTTTEAYLYRKPFNDHTIAFTRLP
jgi:hypothetical protein